MGCFVVKSISAPVSGALSEYKFCGYQSVPRRRPYEPERLRNTVAVSLLHSAYCSQTLSNKASCLTYH